MLNLLLGIGLGIYISGFVFILLAYTTTNSPLKWWENTLAAVFWPLILGKYLYDRQKREG